jgi:uncharacterized protein
MEKKTHSTGLYRKFQDFLDLHFTYKVQKISINAGFTCPNRDGSKGQGGCIYCNNQTFNPEYCDNETSVTEQLEMGKMFFSGKYPTMKYLAYFQAYTNTYADLSKLKSLYQEALDVSDVVGLVIGTRPDCMPNDLLEYLAELSKTTFILVEYGMESTLDKTLDFIQRGHNHACTEDAIRRTAARGIPVGAHLILGLPGETKEDILQHARVLNQLPLDTIKLHQLQLIKGTRLGMMFQKKPALVKLFEPIEYVQLLADFLEQLRPDIAVERFVSQSPANLLIAPNWGLKNYQFTHLVEKCLKERGSMQGYSYQHIP